MIVNYRSKFEQIHSEFTAKHRELVEDDRFEDSMQLHNEYWEAVNWLHNHVYHKTLPDFQKGVLEAVDKFKRIYNIYRGQHDVYALLQAKRILIARVEELMLEEHFQDAQS